jgi:hypothetical protein
MKRFQGWAGWFVAGVLLLVGAGQSDTLRARRLVIEDEQGRERIALEVVKGHPIIGIRNETGDTRWVAGISGDDSGYVVIVDAKSKAHILP